MIFCKKSAYLYTIIYIILIFITYNMIDLADALEKSSLEDLIWDCNNMLIEEKKNLDKKYYTDEEWNIKKRN
jgi:hypothetical protein